MKNFNLQIQTKIIFGRDTISKLSDELGENFKKILLHYGSGSIKKLGLYDDIIKILQENNCEIFELSGVEPNPKLNLVREGVKIVKDNNIDLILAVGGGSVIDSAKAIGIGALYDGDVWDFFLAKAKTDKTIPVGVVLTLPATGSESSTGSVITNEDGFYKRSTGGEFMRPRFAILDPMYTLTLPTNQTFAGVVDIMSHIFERYFTHVTNVDLTDSLSEGALRTVIKNAYILKENPENFDARAEIMFAGTIAHNGLLGAGREEDWASHDIGHEISALYGTTHGETLSIIFPAWMKYVYKENLGKFVQFATSVWGVPKTGREEDIALEGITKFEEFLTDMGMPKTFTEANLPIDDLELMTTKATENGPLGNFKKLYKEDLINIYNIAK